MKKEEAIRIMADCAKQYHENLENKNLLFIFGSLQSPECFEATFLPRHFLHLTGVEPVEDRVRSSTDFYDRCLKGRLRPSDFSITKNGTAEMKLTVLSQLMRVYKTAKMIGDYDFTKSVLYTEKLAGNVSACMGFIRDDKYYIPNTALREDIRDVTHRPQKRILAIYRKQVREPSYTELCYTAKGISISDVTMPEGIVNKIAVPPKEPSGKDSSEKTN